MIRKEYKEYAKGLSQQKPGAMVQDDKRTTLCPIKMTQRSSGLLLSPRSSTKAPGTDWLQRKCCWCLWDLCLLCLMHTVYWSFTWKPPFPTFWCYVPLPLWLQWTPMQYGLCPTEPQGPDRETPWGRSFQSLGNPISALQAQGTRFLLLVQWIPKVEPHPSGPGEQNIEPKRFFKYNRICPIGFWTCSGLATLLSFSHLKWKCPSYACPTIVF